MPIILAKITANRETTTHPQKATTVSRETTTHPQAPVSKVVAPKTAKKVKK
jgi:hypothetical protein